MMTHHDIVLILSGGMDSATLLFDLLHQGHRVRTLSVDYGQRHRRELGAAVEVAAEAGRRTQRFQEHLHLDLHHLRNLFEGSGSSQVDDTPVPHGHYEEQSMKQTVVPNRNMILLAVAAARALSTGARHIAYAAHAGDHAIYPDCRPEFVDAMQGALALADWNRVEILRPYLGMTKGDIVRVGMTLDVPYIKTYTCYEGQQLSCGQCGSCQERLEAFAANGIIDPIPYR